MGNPLLVSLSLVGVLQPIAGSFQLTPAKYRNLEAWVEMGIVPCDSSGAEVCRFGAHALPGGGGVPRRGFVSGCMEQG